MKKYDVYLAGPIFTSEDVKRCEIIEGICEKLGLSYFSPRLHSKVDLSSGDREVLGTKIVEANERAIMESTFVLANVQGHSGSYSDSGTMYEIGFATGNNIPVATYTFEGFGLNLMISQRSIMHFSKITEDNQDEMILGLPKIVDKLNELDSFGNRDYSYEFKYSDLRKNLMNFDELNKKELY